MEQIQVHLKHIILPSNYSEQLTSFLQGRTAARAQGFCSGAVERHRVLTGRVTACWHPPATHVSPPGARQHSGRVLHPSSKKPKNDTQSLAQICSLPVPLPSFRSILSCFHLKRRDKQKKSLLMPFLNCFITTMGYFLQHIVLKIPFPFLRSK